MNKIRLNILGLSVSQTQSGAYALVLSEKDGKLRIPVIIGAIEARAIAIQMEGLNPPRPLTHDLFVSLSSAFGIYISEVLIYKLEEGIFYSKLYCIQNSKEIQIDARTSDAVALALRFKCPIYTTKEILDKAGILLNPESSIFQGYPEKMSSEFNSKNEFEKYSIEKLTKMLKKDITDENYEMASKIRDEIKRRKK
ncbi:MAG: bifunctional nuclease family protein [Prolixibacteraceae bacterium]|nr:bifunctional nuclease family protein [Prolixibacteraceae bacterium]